MNVSILVVEGDEEALDAFLSDLALVPESRWKKGEKWRRGIPHTRSGFSVTLADAATPRELIEITRGWLGRCRNGEAIFKKKGLLAELSLGFTVGDSKQFVAGIEFSAADLETMGACGISLSITAYPTSDEANTEEEHT